MANKTRRQPSAEISRRSAIAKLGLAAGVAYTAPVVLHLDRSANARILPTPCTRPHGNRDIKAIYCAIAPAAPIYPKP